MHRLIVTMVAWLAAIVCVPAIAQQGGNVEASIKRTFEERAKGVKVLSVTRTPYAGLYEIRTDDNELLYTDDKVNFIFAGSILDGRDPRRNLTEERMRKITAVKFDELPLSSGFKIVRGNGKRQVAYFTDPNCPYCRKLEQEMVQLEDVTIHVLLFPILAADSMPKSRAVWCAKDRAKTWLDLMLNNVQPTPVECDTPIEKVLAYGRKIKVESVPTLIFANGERVAGMRPAAQLAKKLDAAAASK
jgi:thiol:disulfide interchange protein DsbC